MSKQTTRNNVDDAADHMEIALDRMPLAVADSATPLPTTIQGIIRYVEQLLTPEEEAICNMATD